MLASCPGMYHPIVVEDVKKSELIGAGTLIIEQKFIHATALVSTKLKGFLSKALRRMKKQSLILPLHSHFFQN